MSIGGGHFLAFAGGQLLAVNSWRSIPGCQFLAFAGGQFLAFAGGQLLAVNC